MEMFLKRLVRIRLLSAIILALPGVFLCIWYSSSAVLALRKYERVVGEESPANAEFFQIYLHDLLHRDVRWIMSPGEPDKSKIETFVLDISHGNMIDLYEGAGKTEGRVYLPAKMSVNSQRKSFDVEVRLRGSRHWHHLTRKKSMKIKVVDGQPYKGHRVFNLINQATPLVVGQKLIADTAAENGVMVPPYEFVRVVLNGEDLGVFHFQAQPDDTLFRKNRTMYSDFFSGNLSGSDDYMALWKDPSLWKKVSSQLHSNSTDVQRLVDFLKMISESSHEQFEQFAKQHIDFEAFAAFEAIDVVFGVEQHGFKENQKLYFDPYKGSWVPVAWDLRGFKHDGVINRVENPITIRLKMLPEYRALRNEAVWDLLTGDASVNEIRKKAGKQIKRLVPELANDRLFSAYKQLPKVNEFAFKMLRPMALDKLKLVVDSELLSYERRHSFLMNQLQKNGFYYRLKKTVLQKPAVVAAPDSALDSTLVTTPVAVATPVATPDSTTEQANSDGAEQSVADGGDASTETAELTEIEAPQSSGGESPSANTVESTYHTPLDVIVAGQAGVSLRRMQVQFEECDQPKWCVLQNGKTVAPQSNTDVNQFGSQRELFASVELVKRDKGDADLNQLEVVPVPTAFPYVIESNCVPKGVEILGMHQITDNQIRAKRATPELIAKLAGGFPKRSDVPKFEIGTRAPYPLLVDDAPMTAVTLGPGKVKIKDTQVYDENTLITVEAGTVFEMSKKASFVFKGKVLMNGTVSNPIVFKRKGKKAWGGIALQGPRTKGSVLQNVLLEGGSVIKGQPVVYTSMLNVHHSENIVISGCTVRNNKGSGDGFHSAYVQDLDVSDLRVENVTMDAVDIEFCTGEITRAWIQNAGDDGIDLMDSKIRLSDSVVLGCAQHGISAGENSELQMNDFLVAWSANGIFAKDSSKVLMETGVLVFNDTGVRVGKPTGLYGGDVEVSANVLYVIGSKKMVERADRKKDRLDEGQILFGFVDERPLRHLFSDVLNIDGGEELDGWLKARKVQQ